jgi:uncharacterized RDD family membrane protein YckC
MQNAPLNPYQSPNELEASSDRADPAVAVAPKTVIRRGSSGVPRFLAAQLDHGFAVVLFFVTAMTIADDRPFQVLPGVAALGNYLGYYFISEWLLGATPGKYFLGLRVRQLSGEPCTASQIAVRTVWRILEVNPVLLGALPAGISIFSTSRRQRIGDIFAGTVVVRK